MSITDADLRACAASAWRGERHRCRWCDRELTGRRQRWCSDECASEYGRNHWWTFASNACKRRDDHRCVDCGQPGHVAHHVRPLSTLIVTFPTWSRLGLRTIEIVRHPRHSDSGCWHHLDGLVTLCDPCHVERHRVLSRRQPVRVEQLTIEVAS